MRQLPETLYQMDRVHVLSATDLAEGRLTSSNRLLKTRAEQAAKGALVVRALECELLILTYQF